MTDRKTQKSKSSKGAAPRSKLVKATRSAPKPKSSKGIKLKIKKTPGSRKPVKAKEPSKSKKAMLLENAELKSKIEHDEKMKLVGLLLTRQFHRQTLIDLAGENALAVIKGFKSLTNDEELAKSLKLKISDVRATLNKLHSEGLVRYLRTKDSETGWYSYAWVLNAEKIQEWLVGMEKEKVMHIFNDDGEKYYCESCGMESVCSFTDAMGRSFKCPNCTKQLSFLDKSKIEEIFRK